MLPQGKREQRTERSRLIGTAQRSWILAVHGGLTRLPAKAICIGTGSPFGRGTLEASPASRQHFFVGAVPAGARRRGPYVTV
jgi:hypothetical protein